MEYVILRQSQLLIHFCYAQIAQGYCLHHQEYHFSEYPFENDAELCLHGAAEHLNGDVKVLCPSYMQAMERFCNVTEKQVTELTDALSDIYPTPLIVYYEEYIKLLQHKITIYANKYE